VSPKIEKVDSALARRKAAVAMLKKGKTQTEVADVFQVSREAVRKWWDAYQDGGDDALRLRQNPRGPKPTVDDEEIHRLMRAARAAKLDSIKEIVELAHRRGIKLARPSIRRKLIRLGYWQ
jgi:transposase